MIDQSVIDKLEFPKVLDLISRYAITESGRNKVLNLLPVNNPDYIHIEDTDFEANMPLLKGGTVK